MPRGTEKDIVDLPVHDAALLQQSDESWAVNAMSEAWHTHVGHGRVRLLVDRPKKLHASIGGPCTS